MQITRKQLLRQLAAGAAVIAFGTGLAACSDSSETEAKKTEVKPADAAKTDVKPADAAKTETKPADTATETAPAKVEEVRTMKPDGTVDVAKLMAPGTLPEISMGKADAPVTIVEYMSMTCPHCARFHNNIFEAIKTAYIDTGKVRFVLREFPLDKPALAAIMLARCAPEGQYFPMVSALFKTQMTWATATDIRASLQQMAKLGGFTQQSFEACISDTKLQTDIRAVMDKGGKEFGVDSTPTFFINGARYTGEMSVAEMSALIDAAQ